MSGTPVELRVGGQTYRVVASANEQELRRLADVVDAKLRELIGAGRQIPTQALLLAALALAHEVEVERERRKEVEQRSRSMLSSLLERIDAALEADDTLRAESAGAEPEHPEQPADV
jgi:cell division protein ZapA